jgi:hypothetical protein
MGFAEIPRASHAAAALIILEKGDDRRARWGRAVMPSATMRAALSEVGRLFREGISSGLPDDCLLDRFLTAGD